MEPSEKTNVVLLACGSFNPITNMHLRMFELARDHLEDTGQFRVVRGIISPVGDSYKKEGLIEACHRVQMARLATSSSDWIVVDPWESEQEEWMETVKVLRHHHEELLSSEKTENCKDTAKPRKRRRATKANDTNLNPSSSHGATGVPPQLKLLCGTDVIESFAVPGLWKPEDIDEIVGRYGVVCVTRGPAVDATERLVQRSDALWAHRRNVHVVREWVTNDVSATHVRRALRRGQSVRYLLPDAALRYARQRALYSGESESRNAGEVLAPLQLYAGTSV